MKKFYRRHQTFMLAILTFAVFLWAAIDVFDVETSVIIHFLFNTLVLIGGTIGCAAVAFSLVILIKRWFKK